MVKRCSKCSKPAVTYIRYNGTHLCSEHFITYVTRRFKKEVRHQGKTSTNTKIGVAVSGGKDSLVTLHLLNDMFSKRPDVKIIVLTIDEGIHGYRDKSIPIVKKNCELLDVDLHIVSFKEIFGATMDEVVIRKLSDIGACSYCGVFRRFCLNTLAKNLYIDKLATGHNLDDISQSILMNFVNADIEKLARLGPHKKAQPGLIPRMMPLRLIPEKENTLYAILKGIQFHDAECPYAVEAMRGTFKDILYTLEERNPGTRHSIVRSYDSMKNFLLQIYPPLPLNACHSCGEPTSHSFCKACELKSSIV